MGELLAAIDKAKAKLIDGYSVEQVVSSFSLDMEWHEAEIIVTLAQLVRDYERTH